MNKHSSRITSDHRHGAARAMLHGVGLTTADLEKPQVGIASVWFEGNPCNAHLLTLSEEVKASVQNTGLMGLRFNTCGVSDAMSMGTQGMRYSLPSRDLIADSIESMMQAQCYDANISIPGCDKNLPGCLIGIARVNRPALIVYGGTIQPGTHNNKRVDVISAFQSYGELIAGHLGENEREDLLKSACPGHGACGGMYTANTMACAIEAMGMSLPYSASTPAIEKNAECQRVGKAIHRLISDDIKPSDIMTRAAFKNAITLVLAMGGSTNAVIHLIAVAKAIGLNIGLDDFQQISESVPTIADLKPSGRYLMQDVHEIGGTPAVMKLLLEARLLDGDGLTVTGLTLAENLQNIDVPSTEQQVVRPPSSPFLSHGHLRILRGNLATVGAVGKITGKEGFVFSGNARVFNSEQAALESIEAGEVYQGDILVIRFVGPKGGPGMPEMLTITSALVGAGLSNDVAVVTDGRFSGGSHGFLVGHVVPEAYEGGLIGLLQDGDVITIDAHHCSIHVEIAEEEISRRRSTWQPLKHEVSGTLLRYRKTVSNAANGCVTDMPD
ncbi:MAG: dihydroxy-acid dehydratase [Pseudomonadota bacterium]